MANKDRYNLESLGHNSDQGVSYSILENETETSPPFDEYRTGNGKNAEFTSSSSLARGLRAARPHVILFAVYIAYLLAGGGFFLLLERKIQVVGEADRRIEVAEYELLKAQIDGAVRDLAEGKEAQNLTSLWEAYTSLAEGTSLPNLLHAHKPDPLSFTRTVFFCATTVSTIGYGDFVPSTLAGKILLVVFSLVGIPFTLIFLADMGRLLARAVVLLVGSWRKETRGADGLKTGVAVVLVLVILIVYQLLGTLVIMLIEGWSYSHALYFSFVTLTTIGFGDLVPVSHHEQIPSLFALLLYVLLGLSVVSMGIALLWGRVVEMISKVAEKFGF